MVSFSKIVLFLALLVETGMMRRKGCIYTVFHADSYNLRYTAHQFTACAAGMRGQAKRYRNSAQNLLHYWKGVAAQNFSQVHEQLALDLEKLADALDRTAGELQSLASRNDHIQELKRQAQQAEWQLQSLNSSDPNYESEAHYYRQRAHDFYYSAEMEARAADERAVTTFREIESVTNSLFFYAVQYHASASSAPKVRHWWEKAMDFLSGAVYSVAASESFGLLEVAVDDEADLRSDEYLQGKIFGDYLATGLGVVTAIDGLLVAAGGAAGGVLLSWTGVGAVAGAGVAVAGLAEAGYGVGAAVKGFSNIEKDQAILEARKSHPDSVSTVQDVEVSADDYAGVVNSNRPWKWRDIPGGENLTAAQKAALKKEAIEKGLIPDVPMKPGTQYPDFEKAGVVQKVDELPKDLWQATDSAQFDWLDARIPGGRPKGTTWHHSEIPGRMELVPFGIHNIIFHKGGRSPGLWSYRPAGR